MLDLVFLVLTFACFGTAHLYVMGCDRLKAGSHRD